MFFRDLESSSRVAVSDSLPAPESFTMRMKDLVHSSSVTPLNGVPRNITPVVDRHIARNRSSADADDRMKALSIIIPPSSWPTKMIGLLHSETFVLTLHSASASSMAWWYNVLVVRYL